MARHITDAQRQVTLPLPKKRVNWKRLMVWLIVACVVAGGSVGGYYLYDYVTSTVSQPPPVVQPPVVVPATPSETQTPDPTKSPTPLKNLQVTWKSNGPTDTGGILAVVVDDNQGSIIYAVGLPPGQFHDLHVWVSNDGGNSWSFLGQFTDPEINFKGKEQIYNNYLNVAVYSGPFFVSKCDPNNESIILKAVQLIVVPTENHPNPPYWEFRLSLDAGKSWLALNLPPGWKSEGNVILTDKYHFDLISSDGTLKLFLAANTVWQAEISLSQ